MRAGPVTSVYVDNICAFGFLNKVVEGSFSRAVESLEDAGFVLHELHRGSFEVANVGIVIQREQKTIRHTKIPCAHTCFGDEIYYHRSISCSQWSCGSLFFDLSAWVELPSSLLQVCVSMVGWSGPYYSWLCEA